jgi:hypothetical protein
MRIVEILLPKNVTDRDLPAGVVKAIDMLQSRIDAKTKELFSKNTTQDGRGFLVTQIRNDIYAMKQLIPRTHEIAENDSTKYEVFDRRTGEKVAGPYSTRQRASRVADKKDLEYGAVRYGYRPVKVINEAVHKVPLIDTDFDLVKTIMEKPIPAAIASIYISEIIDDDEFNSELDILAESDPGRDIRPMVVDWFKRVMPDQMYHFVGVDDSEQRQRGLLSPIHGYDPKMYKGTNDPITGNAYGRFN